MSSPVKYPVKEIEVAAPKLKLLYSKKDSAFALSISVRAVDYFIAQKKLRTVRIGRRVLIPVSSLREFAKANHFGPIVA